MRRWRRGDPADSSVGAGRRVFVIFHGGTTPASPATRINLNVLKTPFLSQYSSALNFCFLVSYTTLVIILRPRNFARPRLRVPLYLVSYRPAQPPVSPPREPTRRLAPPGPPPRGTGHPEHAAALSLTLRDAPRAALVVWSTSHSATPGHSRGACASTLDSYGSPPQATRDTAAALFKTPAARHRRSPRLCSDATRRRQRYDEQRI